MKELSEKVLSYIPGFTYDYLSIVTGPGSFFARKLSGGQQEYVKSMVFLGVSFSLVFLLAWLRLAPQRDFWEVFAFGLITSLLLFVLLSVALVIIGKVFSINVNHRKLIIFICYIEGVVQFFRAVVYTMGLMFVKTLSESLYKFAILTDTYIHFIGAKDYINDFVVGFEMPDPETEALAKLILFSSLGVAVIFTFVMYARSWRYLFSDNNASMGRMVIAFLAFYIARLLTFGG